MTSEDAVDMTNYEPFADIEDTYSTVDETVTLYICGTCGAVVSDARLRGNEWVSGVSIHDRWHAATPPAVRVDDEPRQD